MNILDFPDELLEKVITPADLKTWRNISSVNHRFRDLALQNRFKGRQRYLNIRNDSPDTVKALEHVSSNLCEAITKLCIGSEVTLKSNAQVQGLLLRTVNLRTLRLSSGFDSGHSIQSIQALLQPIRESRAPLRVLKLYGVNCFGDDVQALPGLERLDILHITWQNYTKSTSSAKSCDAMTALIKGSRDTLRNLRIGFDGNYDARNFNLRTLKEEGDGESDAWKALKKFKLDIDKPGGVGTREAYVNILEDIVAVFSNLKKLEFSLSTGRSGIPRFCPEVVTALGKMKALEDLVLSLDLERDNEDTLRRSHDLPWYNRCLHRRYSASQEIANACPSLKKCYWVHSYIDSEGNNQMFRFLVQDEEDLDKDGKITKKRVVKTRREWWMDSRLSRHRDIGELPGEVVGRIIHGVPEEMDDVDSDASNTTEVMQFYASLED